MDHPRPGNGDDSVGIPDDLRCKRSDGKQWRCTAMSMPDKTVCEKHYIQAKKRAANSAMRASLKKAKRGSNSALGEGDIYVESRSDDFDAPLASARVEEDEDEDEDEEDYSLLQLSSSGRKFSERATPKAQFGYSPETPATVRSFSLRNPPKLNSKDSPQLVDTDHTVQFEENWRSFRASPVSGVDPPPSRNTPLDANAVAFSEYSDRSTDSSEETEYAGQTCHQCRRDDRDDVIWCLKCDRRGYCDSCISSWYPDISVQDIQKICPACRGTCNCKICLRGDNLLKVRIKEIPALDKLLYLHCLLSSVLSIVKQIHHVQCYEVELEKKLRGTEIDLTRTRLNADEQMCCNFCRIPIIDYHRHCANCSYDLCISCCRDLREASRQIDRKIHEKETMVEHTEVQRFKLNFSEKFPDWKANIDESIPCPPKEYGGCGYSSLNLSRIFKMNWVAKLVKNVEEMVSGCRVYGDVSRLEKTEYALGVGNESSLYCPESEEFKSSGIADFRKHWARGEPVIVKQVFESSSFSSWDPMEIWRGIQEVTSEKSKEENEIVKAIDCFDWSEVDMELGEFLKGYFEGRINKNGQPEMMKLKNWPSPRASEEFLLYQRPEFISKLPLLEYIHSKWGLLNVAAKLPHYSLQNDAGPKIFISYGTCEELDGGNSVTNLHVNTRDMVYLLVHTCEAKLYGQERTETSNQLELKDLKDKKLGLDDDRTPDFSPGDEILEKYGGRLDEENKDDSMMDHEIENTSTIPMDAISCEQQSKQDGPDISEKTHSGVIWDVFRRQDVPKVVEYMREHQEEFGELNRERYDVETRPLFDERIFLNGHHKKHLKEEYGVEPWSFEQHLGQAVFVPVGCPFQVRNLKSTVQLGLDFLSPESLGEAAKLAEEIRCLPNDHEAKLQVLEVGKISLYAASSAIKEVQKLVLDSKFGAELGFEDPNLTAAVSENLDKMTKRRQLICS